MASTFVRTTSEVWNNKTEEQKNLYNDSIVFIEDTKLIWSNGVDYGAKEPILFNTDELHINTTDGYYYTPGFLENLKITKIPIIGNTKIEFNGNNTKLQLPKGIILSNLVDFQGYAKYILNLDNNYCKINRYEYGDLSNYLIVTYNDGATKLSNNNSLVFESLGGNGLLMTKGPVFENEILITEIDDTISSSAFSSCKSLTSVTIPNGVTSIGSSAFSGCSELTSVTIPNSMTSIGEYAFWCCKSLTSVSIPNSVTSISASAFQECESLTSIIIPNGVTSIRTRVFQGCKSLTSILIPNSVTSIRDYAFFGCDSLTSITIPNSVTYIGAQAFSYCDTLTSILIPNSVTSIGYGVFYHSKSLTSIEVDANNQNYTSIDGVLYDKNVTTLIYCPEGKTSITIPNSITYIGEYACQKCTFLTSIIIPNGITSIGYAAFADCSSLTSITIPNSINSINGYAFQKCTSLTSIIMESTTPPTLDTNVFYNTNSELKIYVPAESVDDYKNATNWSKYADKILPIPN